MHASIQAVQSQYIQVKLPPFKYHLIGWPWLIKGTEPMSTVANNSCTASNLTPSRQLKIAIPGSYPALLV